MEGVSRARDSPEGAWNAAWSLRQRRSSNAVFYYLELFRARSNYVYFSRRISQRARRSVRRVGAGVIYMPGAGRAVSRPMAEKQLRSADAGTVHCTRYFARFFFIVLEMFLTFYIFSALNW